MAFLRKTATGIAIGGVVIAGFAGLIVLIVVTTLLSAVVTSIVIFYGSMLLHHIWPDHIPSATYLQAFGIAFVLNLLRSIFSATVVAR